MSNDVSSRFRVCAPTPRLARAVHLAAMLLVGCVLAQPAIAALYKWTDANGRVVYSDQPPIADVKTEILRGASAPSNPNAVKDMAAKEAELKKRQLDAVDSTKKGETQRADAARRTQMCARAQHQIRQLSAGQIGLSRVNEKGELVLMDDAQRLKERTEVDTWIKDNCAGV